MRYFLGVDGGGTKTHALIADEDGQAVGFAHAGPGSWESIGYDGLTAVLQDVTARAVRMAGILPQDIAGAGMGLAGYDWPSQGQAHLDAIAPIGLKAPVKIVNDAALGITAGSEEGWGISVVSGTGCNCRGLSKDHQREGRMVGGASHWSGEAAGGYDILLRAMRSVAFEWTHRGPATALTGLFIQHTGARDLDDLVEGAYVGRFDFGPDLILRVFEIARQGDPAAVDVMRWAGRELGGMAVGVARQLGLESEAFDVVLIGSIYDGHPAIRESMGEAIRQVAPRARLVRLNVPPVVGGVLLGMEAAGLDFLGRRRRLIQTTESILNHDPERDVSDDRERPAAFERRRTRRVQRRQS
jgi:N-acetylglucosamine kinase-like BadF-type ATPase